MKTTIIAAAALAGIAASATAHAGGRVGAEVLLVPVGDATIDAPGEQAETVDLAVAYGLGALAAFDVSPNFSIGFAPRLVLGIKGEDDEDDEAITELDLAVRFTGHFPLAPGGAELQIHGSPGYSWLFLPDIGDDDDLLGTPSGLVIGVGAGISVPVADNVSLVGDLTYTFGFQGTTVEGFGEEIDLELSIDTAQLGFGLQAKI
jgi:hypothetical protein